MKHPLTLLTVLLLAPLTALAADEVMRVFIFAGQSNMVGSDANAERIDDFPDFRGAGVPRKDVLYSYILGNGDEASKGWVALQPLPSFGPELSFGARIRKAVDAKEGLAIIKFTHRVAQGPDWIPNGSPEAHRNLYPKLLAFIRAASPVAN